MCQSVISGIELLKSDAEFAEIEDGIREIRNLLEEGENGSKDHLSNEWQSYLLEIPSLFQ